MDHLRTRSTLKTASFGALSNAEAIRRGKGRPLGRAGRRINYNAEDYIFSTKFEMQQVRDVIFVGRTTLRGPTSVSLASNGSSPGLMDESPLKYAGWKSRPRKPTRSSPLTRSTSRSSRVLRGSLIVPELTKDVLAEVILEFEGRCTNSCWQIWEALFQVDSGPHGERPLLPLQQCDGADHAGLLPISRGSGKGHFS